MWCQQRDVKRYSESVLLAYFSELVNKGLIASLWPKYSMLKSTLAVKDNVDISKFNKITMFIKRRPKKSKVIEKKHVQKFIAAVPNNIFLMTKVN